MLVLTRKLDQQILIGDDIRVTLIKTRGNTVRIGIEAPREVRVVRGELAGAAPAAPAARQAEEESWQPSEREQPFAHPPQEQPAGRMRRRDEQESRPAAPMPSSRLEAPTSDAPSRLSEGASRARGGDAHLYVGSVGRRGQKARLRRAPLAGRVPIA